MPEVVWKDSVIIFIQECVVLGGGVRVFLSQRYDRSQPDIFQRSSEYQKKGYSSVHGVVSVMLQLANYTSICGLHTDVISITAKW